MHRPMYGPGVQDIPGFWTPCRGFRIPGTGTWILDSSPPYGKRWRLYILPQFLSNLTRPITHKVIFLGGGGEAEFVPVIATLPVLGLKFIKLFCAFL